MSVPTEPTRRSLRRAKRSLQDIYGDRSWFRGVGIVPTDSGLGLRLNIDPAAVIEDDEVPSTHLDFEIEIVRTKGFNAR